MSGALDLKAHYELQEKIGMGAFGEVFKAVDTRSDEVCAVKIVDLERAGDEIDDVQQVQTRVGRGETTGGAALMRCCMQEIAVLSQCACEQLTKYIGSFIQGTQLWCATCCGDGGSYPRSFLTITMCIQRQDHHGVFSWRLGAGRHGVWVRFDACGL